MDRDKARSKVLWVQYLILSALWPLIEKIGFEREAHRVFEVANACWESGFEYEFLS